MPLNERRDEKNMAGKLNGCVTSFAQSFGMKNMKTFKNCKLCIAGNIVEDVIHVDSDTGRFINASNNQSDIDIIDLDGKTVAPGYLELQSNGVLGFHFTHYQDDDTYRAELEKVSGYLVSKGITAFWCTIPTVSADNAKKVPLPSLTLFALRSAFLGTGWRGPKPTDIDSSVFNVSHSLKNFLHPAFEKSMSVQEACRNRNSTGLGTRLFSTSHQILPSLSPRPFRHGASLLGAHVEGGFLAPSKRGAHNADLFLVPDQTTAEEAYGEANLKSTVKLITLAPELAGALPLISRLTSEYGTVVSLGHSAADHDVGTAALTAGATALTHVFNAMNPFHHRDPGLAGCIASPHAPYYSLIADGVHLHPATLTTAYRANPARCVLITDSIELAGLPDGVYPGHAQIPHPQRKSGDVVTIDGTDTLIGSCVGLDECVRNLKRWSGCTLAEAVRCVTENVADMMGERERGKLEVGRKADFVVLDADGVVLQTWVSGEKVYERE